MRFIVCAITLGTSLGAAALPAQAAVTFLSQSRSVTAQYTTPTTTASVTSPDFSIFNQFATISNPPQLKGAATTSQNSELGQTQITNASHITASGGNQFSDGVGNSSFLITFSVDTPTPWTISGNWSFNNNNALTGPATGTMNLHLEQVSGPVLYDVNFVPTLQVSSLSGTLGQAGVFLPGNTYSYSITLAETVHGAGQGGVADINAVLALPSPGAAAILVPLGMAAIRRRREP